MTEEKKCLRCGACCRVLPIFTQHMHPEAKRYYLNRGLVEDKEQGCILIPHDCRHLGFHTDGKTKEYFCDIHDDPDRPEICRKYKGQKFLKGARIYVPPGCAYRREL